MALSTYTYEPLDDTQDEIRLIRFLSRDQDLEQGYFNPPLELTLVHVSLAARPQYHALSYVWGSSMKPDMVRIDGKAMNITRNLYEALIRFHLDPTVEYLWADALCINQADNDEKALQVKKMRQIFTQATRVVAYLGTPPSGREQTVESIALRGRELILEHGWDLFASDRRGYQDPDQMPTSRFWQIFHHIAQRAHRDREFLEMIAKRWGLGSDDGGIFPHREMLYFLRRPIWTRVWIIQEFTCAKDLFLTCGLSELKFIYWIIVYWIYVEFYEWKRHSMDLGPRAAEYLSSLAALESYTFQTVLTMQSMHRWGHMEALRKNSFTPLRELLGSTFRLGATDPRDRVFALLGIAKDAPKLGLIPNYSKSYAEVLLETAWRLVARGVFILDDSRGLKKSELAPDLPSWAPEWSLRPPQKLNPIRREASLRFLASGHTEMSTASLIEEADYSQRDLCMSGISVAYVVQVGDVVDFPGPRETPQNLQRAQHFLEDLRQLSKNPSVTRPPGQSTYVQEALRKIPVAYRRLLRDEEMRVDDRIRTASQWQTDLPDRPEVHIWDPSLLEAEFQFLSGNQRVPAELSDSERSSWLLQNCKRYFEELHRYSDETRPMLCSGTNDVTFLGTGPREMQAGDQVFIFQGAHVPFVVRPMSGGLFQVVGETYVYGMMYGEMINGHTQFEMSLARVNTTEESTGVSHSSYPNEEVGADGTAQ
ncbi:heterokaryon incompatibility protein-domain-containing protein [Ilyonectria robusta]|uniref:heterokaryon incompatibility protein-domain-containing protein n=1 Tax=Ilyonectria robusta TaxID=1079257 RepID=UPI001E8DD11D|nr:heterokaryon incompatibility protein-domain-containing protein [Ilyonectria robusta]KAH8672402.1 heterokaryon incompatibility protein-domain-containing protein [Ilyonectria robusta]